MKIPIFCSLIPAELVVHCGFEPYYVAAGDLVQFRAQEYHCAFHENICSYSKSLYDYFLRRHKDFDIIIIPTSCDAMKKLYNALKMHIPPEKLYILDVPKSKDLSAKRYLSAEFGKLLNKLRRRAWGGRVGVMCHNRFSTSSNTNKMYSSSERSESRSQNRNYDTVSQGRGIKIGILGSNIPLDVLNKSLEKFGFEGVFLNHCLDKSYPDENLLSILKDGGGFTEPVLRQAQDERVEGLRMTGESISEYADKFLDKNTCPRTNDQSYKEGLVGRIIKEDIKGLIVNALKFCDFHPFDYRYLKEKLGPNFPALMIEHELTANYEGQTMTRLEAFFENIQKKIGRSKKGKPQGRKGRYFIGIDSGSHATKLVCVDKDKNIVSREVVDTGTSVKKSAELLLERFEDKHTIGKNDIACIIATGYGRNKIECADDVITEISCHALGAHHILGRAGTIIDIGGQDSKAIKIDDHGSVIRFAMNDKCAAGTGRFLEVMANKLEMSLEEFSNLAFMAEKFVPISSMCSVFAESEVISLIASGKSKEEIAKGIHKAIAERTIALARRVEGMPPYYMAGGVAKNRGLVRELEECLDSKLEVIEYPQFSGALGAALIALRGNDVG